MLLTDLSDRPSSAARLAQDEPARTSAIDPQQRPGLVCMDRVCSDRVHAERWHSNRRRTSRSGHGVVRRVVVRRVVVQRGVGTARQASPSLLPSSVLEPRWSPDPFSAVEPSTVDSGPGRCSGERAPSGFGAPSSGVTRAPSSDVSPPSGSRRAPADGRGFTSAVKETWIESEAAQVAASYVFAGAVFALSFLI